MIKDNQKIFNRLLVCGDACLTALSLIVGYIIKFYIFNKGPGPGVLPLIDYAKLLIYISMVVYDEYGVSGACLLAFMCKAASA